MNFIFKYLITCIVILNTTYHVPKIIKNFFLFFFFLETNFFLFYIQILWSKATQLVSCVGFWRMHARITTECICYLSFACYMLGFVCWKESVNEKIKEILSHLTRLRCLSFNYKTILVMPLHIRGNVQLLPWALGNACLWG